MSSSITNEPVRASLMPQPCEPGVLVLDPQGRRLRGPRGEALLARQPYRVAERLMRRAGEFVSHEALLGALYAGEEQPDTADVCLRRVVRDVRAAVARASGDVAVVIACRGEGYALIVKGPEMEKSA